MKKEGCYLIIALDGFKKEEVTICHESRYLNTLVLGQKGTGKSEQVLLNMFYQDLESTDHSLFVFSSKGDTSYKLFALAKNKGRKVHLIKPETNNFHFNLLNGEEHEVLEHVMILFEHFFEDMNGYIKEANKTLLRYGITVIKRTIGENGTLEDVHEIMTNRNGLGKKRVLEFSKMIFEDSLAELEKNQIVHWFLNEYYADTQDNSLFMICSAIKMKIRAVLDKEAMYGFNAKEEDLPDLKKVIQKKEIIIVDTEFLSYKDHSSLMGTFFLLKIQKELLKMDIADAFIYIDDFQRYYPVLTELFEGSHIKNIGATLFLQETKQLDTYPAYKNVIMNNVSNLILLERIAIDDYFLYKEQVNAEMLNRKRGEIIFNIIKTDGTAKSTNGVLYTNERLVLHYEKFMDYKKELPKKKKRRTRIRKIDIPKAVVGSSEAVTAVSDVVNEGNPKVELEKPVNVENKPFEQVKRKGDNNLYLSPHEVLKDDEE